MEDHGPCSTLDTEGTSGRRKEVRDLMTSIKAFIKRHRLLSFYALVFAITWGGLIPVVGDPSEILGSPELLGTRFGLVMLAWLAGPSVASILMTGLVHGREGLREFGSRLLKWRVGARWYAIALLTAPLLSVGVLLALSLSSPEYLPTILTTSDKAALLLQGIVGTFVGGIFEELGWTGFATPTLLRACYEPTPRMPLACWRKRQAKATK